MASNSLPSGENYIANHIQDTNACSICLCSFDEQHVPARLAGPHGCNHIFGSECIKVWLQSRSRRGEPDNFNKCPVCRTHLFPSEESDNEDDEDYQDGPQAAQSTPSVQQTQTQARTHMTVESFGDPQCLNTAYLLMKYIVDGFDDDPNYSDEFIRECVDDALQELAEEKNVLVIIEDGDQLWPRIICAIRRLALERNVIEMLPAPIPLRCVQVIADEVQWHFPNSSFNYGDLVNPFRLAELYPSFGGPTIIPNICCDRDLARWVVRSLNHWLCASTGPLGHQMSDSELRGPIKRWHLDELAYRLEDEDCDALLDVLHKLRRILHEKGRLDVEPEIDYWVNEVSNACKWPSFNETPGPCTVNINPTAKLRTNGVLFMPVARKFGAYYVDIESSEDQQLICSFVNSLCQLLFENASSIPRTDNHIRQCVTHAMSPNSRVTPLILLDDASDRLVTAIKAVIDICKPPVTQISTAVSSSLDWPWDGLWYTIEVHAFNPCGVYVTFLLFNLVLFTFYTYQKAHEVTIYEIDHRVVPYSSRTTVTQTGLRDHAISQTRSWRMTFF